MKIEQIKVVAGLILQNNKLLICQRPNFKDHPLKWEFPGGKIKNDETNEEALIREIYEGRMKDLMMSPESIIPDDLVQKILSYLQKIY